MDDAQRLAALRSYEVLDTPADPRIDVFVRVAAQFYDVPFSMVSLVDEERAWFKAAVGVGVSAVPRDDAFCAHAIMDPRVMVVEDTRADARFAGNPLITGEDGFRFYAGAPIVSAEGHALGTLCIGDRRERTLDEAGRQRLADLATGVGAALDLHRNAVRLRRAATQDPLTGLANRALFGPALDEAAAGATVASPAAVVCIDLDHFKQVNDRHGHEGGDTLLRVTGERLGQCLRPLDLPARLGGDEFAVLLRAPLDAGAVEAVTARILRALAVPVRINGEDVPIRASAGFAAAPEHATDGAGLMRMADLALYAAKAAGRGTLAAPPAGRAASPSRPAPAHDPTLLDDLQAAVATGAFDLHWQPCVVLRTGAVRGWEALLRWKRPGHGSVAPEAFMGLVARHGLGPALDAFVLRTVCHAAAGWPGREEVSMNLSRASLLAGFAERVAEELAVTGLAADRLVLELDERAVSEQLELAGERVAELAAVGVTVALHDYGGGDSALACLRDVPFGRIKLGRTLVGAVGRSRRADALARHLAQMAVAFGSVVCAEGIETPEQLAFMRDAGCTLGQGFLLGRPTALPGIP